MGLHALLSASGSKMWLACTPSAVLGSKMPDSTSVYAEEGTLAHELGELLLRKHLGEITTRKYNAEFKKIVAHAMYSEEILVNATNYSNYVIERWNALLATCGDAMLAVETRLDFSDYVPEGFGTGDATIIADGTMEVIDYKNGKGVPVYAEWNSQMMLYALGALKAFGDLYKIDKVMMTVYQPRIDNVSSWEITVDELKDWAEKELRPKAQLAFKGEGEFVSGEHCRFCKVKATCRARAEKNLELAKMEFKKADLLSDDEITEVLLLAKELKSWVDDVWDQAFAEELKGKEWPGFKLVEGRSNRKYGNEEAVAVKLSDCGYPEDVCFEKKLKGITAMEKALTKPVFNELLGDLIVKPEGRPTLVEASDKREPINSAKADFCVEV